MDKVVGLIGNPLRHSVSPAFQQAAFDFYFLKARYELWETPTDKLGEVAERVRHPDCLGANVTIPYKEEIIPYLDSIDEHARRIGAVNTIVNRDGILTGYNTDVQGFLESLAKGAEFDPYAESAVVLGAGGAARAVIVGLIEAGAARIAVANRGVDRGIRVIEQYGPQYPEVELLAMGLDDARLATVLRDSSLVVNATPVGMRHSAFETAMPLDPALLSPDTVVFDLVYNPPETAFMRAARARGCKIIGGLLMLVYQGAFAFELWTGKRAPTGLMLERAKEALNKLA